jgi:Putative MetA-pathway of phenol degradation
MPIYDAVRMKRVLFLGLAACGIFCSAARAQVTCSPGDEARKLACVVPNALNLTAPSSQNLGFLNEAVGSQVGDLPLASPASGIIYVNDPQLNLPVPSNLTLGPVLTQRAETIGAHKIYVAATHQFFRFGQIDGVSLKQLPILLVLQGGAAVTTSNNRLDLTVHQFAMYFTMGLTDRVDISIAVPILDVHERFTTSGVEYLLSTGATQTFHDVATSGHASGVGDTTLAIKGTVWKPSSGGLAVGTELRLPSGDAENFLGSGAVGIKPFVSLNYGKRIAPHFNLSYEYNGNSSLVTDSSGNKDRLASRLLYSVGADWGAKQWLTIAGDVLIQRMFDARRVRVTSQAIANPPITPQTIQPFTANYNRADLSLGAKVKPLRSLILTGNVLMQLNDSGLRARYVPLFGASYTF